ncbi:hypothetical protein F5X68DRAFT_55422 [Plectosphaerella plurivora]|uniref:CCZ1/INTU/HSP4 first Longin domain-containing protein n=1 Tax=Plectosphaerella plurivora TaxID=936078 RepID=A0A9P8V1T0_9PEZI|nr:hypothetical protein F5X68DRAFT_55422 [Plectosphaerella plurivora]
MASPGAIVPAQLGFLAIFNPSLGNTDETIDDQIVYYASVNTQSHTRRRQRSRARPTENVSQEERNERLRQIGLAQGMVDFGRSFSNGVAVDTIDTEKSRVVLHELEPNWWILASIDLTRLPLPPKLPIGKTGEASEAAVEYSSKEIKPATLLMKDLLRAHSTFLLHHDTSLSALFVRTKRTKFVSVLSRYWDLYLSTWNVMLHGNPTRSIFGGINIAASGELGIGVGEEERGSGEREVLEGLVGRIDGLVDIVVSKFGDHETPNKDEKTGNTAGNTKGQWLGTGREPEAEDGAIFLGTGTLSRNSLRDISHWMEDLYTWGENAYGVIESPTSSRQARRAKKAADAKESRPPLPSRDSGSSSSTKTLAERRGQSMGTVAEAKTPELPPTPMGEGAAEDGEGHMDKLMSYMKLGYGTYWSIGKTGGPPLSAPEAPSGTRKPKPRAEDTGHFLIGLLGDVEDDNDVGGGGDPSHGFRLDLDGDSNSRTMLRTVHVELEETARNMSESKIVKDLSSLSNEVTPLGVGGGSSSLFDAQDQNKITKLRVVVYVSKPYIFTFLFQLRTDSLALDSMYRSLHQQLVPLRKPLQASTSYRPHRPDVGLSSTGIYDLIWDPAALTVHSTVPNIPEPSDIQSAGSAGPVWSRAEAMNSHMQMLNIHAMTRSEIGELERTCKTNRGWWVVWTRILERPPMPTSPPEDSEEDEPSSYSEAVTNDTEDSGITPHSKDDESPVGPTVKKEIFLLRRASDHAGTRNRSGSYGESLGWTDGTGRLAQGIGIDTRKYIEGLLSLDR